MGVCYIKVIILITNSIFIHQKWLRPLIFVYHDLTTASLLNQDCALVYKSKVLRQRRKPILSYIPVYILSFWGSAKLNGCSTSQGWRSLAIITFLNDLHQCIKKESLTWCTAAKLYNQNTSIVIENYSCNVTFSG